MNCLMRYGNLKLSFADRNCCLFTCLNNHVCCQSCFQKLWKLKVILRFSLRFDSDTTELHSWMTRSEAVLQSPEFAVFRKEGNLSDLKERVNVGETVSVHVC